MSEEQEDDFVPLELLPYSSELVTRLPYAESKLRETIAQAIGEASTCWENLSSAGTFDAVRATKVAKELTNNVIALTGMGEPNLGCATMAQLIDEIRARIDIHVGLDYRTVDDDG